MAWRATIGCLSLLLLAAARPTATAGERLGVTLRAVPLDPSDPARTRVGQLDYLAGWELRSSDRRFGGFSALAVEGERVILLSDTGARVTLRIRRGRAVAAQLRRLPGRESVPRQERDSESMVIDPSTGDAWVGFEHGNLIRRYAAGFSREVAAAAPPAMAEWPANGGAEAMVRLRDGRFLVFSERGGAMPGAVEALLFDADPTADSTPPPMRFAYRPPAGHVPTDAVLLPDGRVVVLNRAFGLLSGISAVVAIVDPRRITGGAMVAGEEIARLRPPLTVDNMEALAVTEEAGRTILWIASDDNFLSLQRSLLLKFALIER